MWWVVVLSDVGLGMIAVLVNMMLRDRLGVTLFYILRRARGRKLRALLCLGLVPSIRTW